DFGRLDTEHGRAEIAKLRRSLGGPMLGLLIARCLVVAVYAHCMSRFWPKGKPSGERNSTVASNAFRVRANDVSVRMTPLTWGCQALVAMSIRIRPLSSDRAETESVSKTSPCHVSIV